MMHFALFFPLLLCASAAPLLLDPEHCRISPAGTDNVQCHWPSNEQQPPKTHKLQRILRESDLLSPSSPSSSSSSSTYLMFGLKVGSNKISGGGYNFMFAVTMVDNSGAITNNCFLEFPHGCSEGDYYYCYNTSASQSFHSSGDVIVTNVNRIIPGTNLPGSWAEIEKVAAYNYDGSKNGVWDTDSWSKFSGVSHCGCSGSGNYCLSALSNDATSFKVGDGHCQESAMTCQGQGGCTTAYSCLKSDC